MVLPQGEDAFGPGRSVPDLTRLETRMWIYFLATEYIDAGMEAIHLGQIEWMGEEDTGLEALADLAGRIRAYAATHARRHWVLLDAHTHGRVRDGKLLLDFHSYPMRVVEGPTVSDWSLAVGYFDSIYGLSLGGITPSGWACEHLPYLVELDHGYPSGREGRGPIGPPWVWGYDEVSWFAQLTEADRNAFLWNAWHWLDTTDAAAHLQMPGQRQIYVLEDDSYSWYMAHRPGPLTPDGFNQEPVIELIWSLDSDYPPPPRHPTGRLGQ
jgi:hypothetical protein